MTDLIMPRRSFITGLVGLVAAPAVVKASSLMQVKTIAQTEYLLEHANERYIGYSISKVEVNTSTRFIHPHWIPKEPPPYVIELYNKIGEQYG